MRSEILYSLSTLVHKSTVFYLRRKKNQHRAQNKTHRLAYLRMHTQLAFITEQLIAAAPHVYTRDARRKRERGNARAYSYIERVKNAVRRVFIKNAARAHELYA